MLIKRNETYLIAFPAARVKMNTSRAGALEVVRTGSTRLNRLDPLSCCNKAVRTSTNIANCMWKSSSAGCASLDQLIER